MPGDSAVDQLQDHFNNRTGSIISSRSAFCFALCFPAMEGSISLIILGHNRSGSWWELQDAG